MLPASSQTRLLQLSPFRGRIARVDALKKIAVDIRFFYRAVYYEAKKGRDGREARRGRLEHRECEGQREGERARESFWPPCQDRSQPMSADRGVLYMRHNAMGVVMAE